MADDERRAEIEAVARALTDFPDEWDEHDEGDKDVFRRMAADGIAALDRVRDARGVKIPPLCDRCGGDHYVTEHDRVRDARRDDEAELERLRAINAELVEAHSTLLVEAARSPQGEEEHEQAPGESPTPDDDVIVRWECPECGWSIPDEHSAGEGQPCEAWILDDETGEHGPTQRVRYRRIRSPRGERATREEQMHADGERTAARLAAQERNHARRPQGEDHEAELDIPAAEVGWDGATTQADRDHWANARYEELRGWVTEALNLPGAPSGEAREALRNGLTGVSRLRTQAEATRAPSRDGTVAEDHEAASGYDRGTEVEPHGRSGRGEPSRAAEPSRTVLPSPAPPRDLSPDGIEAAAQAMTDWPDEWDEHDEGDKDVFRQMARDGIAAYRAHVSPSRDGTVAVEDALRNVERAAREVDALFDGEGPGQWTYNGKRITDEAAMPLLSMHDYLNDVSNARAGSPASTGDRPSEQNADGG